MQSMATDALGIERAPLRVARTKKARNRKGTATPLTWPRANVRSLV